MRSLAFIIISLVLLVSIMMATSAIAAPQSINCISDGPESHATRIAGIIDDGKGKLTIESEDVYGDSSDFETAKFARKIRDNEDSLSFAKYVSGDSLWFYFRLSIPKDVLGQSTDNFPAYFGWNHDENIGNGELTLDCQTKTLPDTGVLSWNINQLDNGGLHDLHGRAKYTFNGELGHEEHVIKKAFYAEDSIDDDAIISEILYGLRLNGVLVRRVKKTASNLKKVVAALDFRQLDSSEAKKQITTFENSLERNSVGRNLKLFQLEADFEYEHGVLNGFALLDTSTHQVVIVLSGYSE